MVEIIGCNFARDVWITLETAYYNSSKAWEIQLIDELQTLKCGSRSIADFGIQFKGLCDKLSAIGHPVSNTNQVLWFLHGLGPKFATFSTTQFNMITLP